MAKLYAPCVGSMLKLLIDVHVGEYTMQTEDTDFTVSFCVGGHGNIKSIPVSKSDDTPGGTYNSWCIPDESTTESTGYIFYIDTTTLQPGVLYLSINFEYDIEGATIQEVARYDTDIQLWETPQVE